MFGVRSKGSGSKGVRGKYPSTSILKHQETQIRVGFEVLADVLVLVQAK